MKLWHSIWKWVKPYLTPKMLPFLLVAYTITNLWAYAFIGIGVATGNDTFTKIGGAYIAFLWLPFSAEKAVTIFIAGWLYKLVYKEKFKE